MLGYDHAYRKTQAAVGFTISGDSPYMDKMHLCVREEKKIQKGTGKVKREYVRPFKTIRETLEPNLATNTSVARSSLIVSMLLQRLRFGGINSVYSHKKGRRIDV